MVMPTNQSDNTSGVQDSNHLPIMLSQSNVANPYQAAKKRYLAELEQQREHLHQLNSNDVEMAD
jgi:hypothetical protein